MGALGELEEGWLSVHTLEMSGAPHTACRLSLPPLLFSWLFGGFRFRF